MSEQNLVPNSGSIVIPTAILSTTTGINAQNIANTPLYTVPVGKVAVITSATIRCTAATAITTGPALGIGNIAGTNNIFASTAINVLTTTSNIFGFQLVGMSILTPASGIVYLNLNTASIGTSQTIACDLIGYFV